MSETKMLMSFDVYSNASERLGRCYMNLTRGPVPSSAIATPLVCFITGVVGNISAVVVMYTMRRDVKKTAYYVLLVGLAWTDLLGQLTTSPIVIAVYANDLQWVGGTSLCTYHAFAMIFFGTITPILVCTLACERFLALICTYSYSRIVTVRSVKILFVVCWIVVIIFSSLPFMGLGNYEKQYPGTWCFLNYHNESYSDTVYAYFFSFLNILSIALILALNCCVCFALIRMRRKRLDSAVRHTRTITDERVERSASCLEIESQMVVFLCVISGVFVTCWLPLNVNILINLSHDLTCHKWDLLTVRMASINQILDPWIYIILRKSVLHKIYRFAKTRIIGRPSSKDNCATTRGAETRLLRANLQPRLSSVEIIYRDGGYVKVDSKDLSMSGAENTSGDMAQPPPPPILADNSLATQQPLCLIDEPSETRILSVDETSSLDKISHVSRSNISDIRSCRYPDTEANLLDMNAIYSKIYRPCDFTRESDERGVIHSDLRHEQNPSKSDAILLELLGCKK